MIALVEGASRQKTPNEIALTILLAALTIVFLLAVVTLKPFGIYSGVNFSNVRADFAAGLSDSHDHRRLVERHRHRGHGPLLQKNVLATSGRAVEAAGDVDVLLLDKTGTITLGNRMATDFLPAPGVTGTELADAAQLASLADETPEGRSIVVLARKISAFARAKSHELPSAQFVPFTAQTRMSGVDFGRQQQIRKGAAESRSRSICRRQFADGSRERSWKTFRVPAARRSSSPTQRTRAWRDSSEGHCQRRHQGTFRAASHDGHPHRDDHRRQ